LPRMNVRFPPPEYRTPIERRRKRRYAFFPTATLPFSLELIWLVRWGRRLAVRGGFDRERLVEGCARAGDVIEGSGGRIHITGLDIVAAGNDPVVFVANHMSTMETFLLPAVITPHRPLTFVVKESLVGGFFGPIMRTLDPVTVTRRDPRADFKKVMVDGVRRLGAGDSICIFPQTTRMTTFDPAQFNTLGVKLARRAGVPIIPLALKTDFYSPGWPIREFGAVRPERDLQFAFGSPISPTLSQRDAHESVLGFVGEHLRKWGVPTLAAAPLKAGNRWTISRV